MKVKVFWKLKLKDFIKKFFSPVAAKKFAKTLVRRKNENNYLILINNFALGDLLFDLAYLEEFRKVIPRENRIVILVPQKFEQIVLTFKGFDDIYLIPSKGLLWFQFRSLTAFSIKQNLSREHIIILPSSIPYIQGSNVLKGLRTVLRLGENASIQYHNLLPLEVFSIPNFALDCKKIVLLNPYSNSEEIDAVGKEFFEKVCFYLKGRGYNVYTNVVKDQLPIQGSLALKCSLEELLGVAAEIPLFVSLRSGICDFLINTGVNMFVVYNKFWHYDHYPLSCWKPRGGVEEILYDENTWDADLLFGRFIKFFSSIDIEEDRRSLR